jgi:hypothetical protein
LAADEQLSADLGRIDREAPNAGMSADDITKLKTKAQAAHDALYAAADTAFDNGSQKAARDDAALNLSDIQTGLANGTINARQYISELRDLKTALQALPASRETSSMTLTVTRDIEEASKKALVSGKQFALDFIDGFSSGIAGGLSGAIRDALEDKKVNLRNLFRDTFADAIAGAANNAIKVALQGGMTSLFASIGKAGKQSATVGGVGSSAMTPVFDILRVFQHMGLMTPKDVALSSGSSSLGQPSAFQMGWSERIAGMFQVTRQHGQIDPSLSRAGSTLTDAAAAQKTGAQQSSQSLLQAGGTLLEAGTALAAALGATGGGAKAQNAGIGSLVGMGIAALIPGAGLAGIGLGGSIGALLGGVFAGGGIPPVGVPSIVGERGMELFVPSVPGRIYSHEQLSAMVGGSTVNVATPGGAGGHSFTINHYGDNVNQGDHERMSNNIAWAVGQRLSICYEITYTIR